MVFRDAVPWSFEKCDALSNHFRYPVADMRPLSGDDQFWKCANSYCITENKRCDDVCDCGSNCDDEDHCHLKIKWGYSNGNFNEEGCLTGATVDQIKGLHDRRRRTTRTALGSYDPDTIKATLQRCTGASNQDWYFYGIVLARFGRRGA